MPRPYRYFLDIPDDEIPAFETFFKAFLRFAKSVYVQGDQLSEVVDNLESTVRHHLEDDHNI